MKFRIRLIIGLAIGIFVAVGFVVFHAPRSLKDASKDRPTAASPADGAGLSGSGLVTANVSSASSQTNPPPSREFDPAVNPYAGGLRSPGKSKRAWDTDILADLQNRASGDPIR
jgi:hypothetical protein